MDYRFRDLLEEINFTFAVLEKHESFRNEWLDEQIVIIKTLIDELNRVNSDNSSNETTKSIIKETKVEVNKSARKLFKEIEFRVKQDRDSMYKLYFPKNLTETTRDKKGFLRAFENISLKLESETLESLLQFKMELSEIIERLKSIDKDITNQTANKQFSKIDSELLYKKLKQEYQRLKIIIQGTAIGTKVKYSIFILKRK
ncbi:hypothetical protein JXR93_14090 [bacterium]|nr:hypothetical protein [bacterium]